jgi:hypothetical protein
MFIEIYIVILIKYIYFDIDCNIHPGRTKWPGWEHKITRLGRKKCPDITTQSGLAGNEE